jgi:hypothetical protein
MYEANIVPLTPLTCKVVFINWNAPRTDDILQVVYEGDSFDVIQDGISRNRWCIVDASFSDFDNNSRVLLDITDTPSSGDFINQFNNDQINTFSGDQTVLFS